MFARIEVALRPEFPDAQADALMKRLELISPTVRAKVRWARLLDVHWLDLDPSREEIIGSAAEIFWDRVTQWLFTGNLIPSAAGKSGGIHDLIEAAPQRPGKFWAIERRFRPGVADAVGRTVLEAFEIHLGRPLSPESQACSGGLLLLEGTALNEDDLALVAREVFTHAQIETWTVLNEAELKKNDRFHPERVKRDFPKPWLRPPVVEKASLPLIPGREQEWSEGVARRWAGLNASMREALVEYYSRADIQTERSQYGLKDPLELELTILDQFWRADPEARAFHGPIHYTEESHAGDESRPKLGEAPAFEIPSQIPALHQATLASTLEAFPRSWMLTSKLDSTGLVAWDEDQFLGVSVVGGGGHLGNAYGSTVSLALDAQRALMSVGIGARAAFQTQALACPSPLEQKNQEASRENSIFSAKRFLEGLRRGTSHALGGAGVPLLNTAHSLLDSFTAAPLISYVAGGWIPRRQGEQRIESLQAEVGDRLFLVGELTGKRLVDPVHDPLAPKSLDEYLDTERFELEDPLAQRRATDFILAARDLGLLKATAVVSRRGLAGASVQLTREGHGVLLDITQIPQKTLKLPVSELLFSETPGRFLLAVDAARAEYFRALLSEHRVACAEIGEITGSGTFDVVEKALSRTVSLRMELLARPFALEPLRAIWKGPSPVQGLEGQLSLHDSGARALLGLLGRPAICSKASLLREIETEIQGLSVVKPFHTAQTGTAQEWSGPNDCGAVLPSSASNVALAIGSGVQSRYSRFDPYLQGIAAVDEAVRNLLSVGVEYGRPESFFGLTTFFALQGKDPSSHALGALVRAAYGVRRAAHELTVPILASREVCTRLAPTREPHETTPWVSVTAVGKTAECRSLHLPDFKFAGDFIYVLGPARFALVGSEIEAHAGGRCPGPAHLPAPDWEVARRLYSWLGRSQGTEHARLRSLHDVSEGGLLVALSESLLARGLGAQVQVPEGRHPWEFCFGEGFHSFVASCAELDAASLEAEWLGLGVPFLRFGRVTSTPRLDVRQTGGAGFQVETELLRASWASEGVWE